MTAPNKSHKSILQIYSSVLAKISSAIALILTYIWAKTENTEEKYLGGLNWNDQVFNWYNNLNLMLYLFTNLYIRHPVLMVAGLVFAFTCGITSFHHPCLSKSVNKTLHVLSYILAIICFSVGLKAVWKSHDKKDDYKANLYSFHAWIGLVAVVLFAQNFVLGCFHFLNAYVPIRYRQMYMPFHIFLGIIAFIASIIATETGTLFHFILFSYSEKLNLLFIIVIEI